MSEFTDLNRCAYTEAETKACFTRCENIKSCKQLTDTDAGSSGRGVTAYEGVLVAVKLIILKWL